MRKKTIKYGLDNIFWYIIYLLPVILAVCAYLGVFQGEWYRAWSEIETDWTAMPFRNILKSILEDLNFLFSGSAESTNPIYAVLCRVFSNQPFEQGNILPVFSGESPFLGYIAYFISVYIIHLMVDFVLFIPRLAHKWLNYFTRTED